MSEPASAPPGMPRHVCFLVDNLEASIASFTEVSGTSFGPVQEMPMRLVRGGEEIHDTVRFAYSVDGTLELVGRSSAGMFGPDVPSGLHHIGHMLTAELEGSVKHQESLGGTVSWCTFLGDWQLAAYLEPTADRPVRVELISPDLLSKVGPPPS